MKYFGAIVVAFLVLSIIIGGTYHEQDVVENYIQLSPTDIARPGLVVSTLMEINGVLDVRLDKTDDLLYISYDPARFDEHDLENIMYSLGYGINAAVRAEAS